MRLLRRTPCCTCWPSGLAPSDAASESLSTSCSACCSCCTSALAPSCACCRCRRVACSCRTSYSGERRVLLVGCICQCAGRELSARGGSVASPAAIRLSCRRCCRASCRTEGATAMPRPGAARCRCCSCPPAAAACAAAPSCSAAAGAVPPPPSAVAATAASAALPPAGRWSPWLES